MATLTHDQRRAALDLVRMDDDGDPWGTCMMHWFGVAEVLYWEHGEVPAAWEFHPGIVPANAEDEITEWPGTEYRDALRRGDLSAEQLTYVGNVLDRWSRCIRHAGRDY